MKREPTTARNDDDDDGPPIIPPDLLGEGPTRLPYAVLPSDPGQEPPTHGALRTAAGLTARQDLFCRGVAAGNTMADSYRHAFRVGASKTERVYNYSSRLMARPDVAARIRDLRADTARKEVARAEVIRAHVVSSLMTESTDRESKAGDRIRALELLGKLVGVDLFRDRQLDPKTEQASAENLSAELERRLKEYLIPAPARLA